MRFNLQLTLVILVNSFQGSIAQSTVFKVGKSFNRIDRFAVFELESDDKGFLLPRLSNQQLASMVGNLPNGLLVYNTDQKRVQLYETNSWSNLLTSKDIVSSPVDNNSWHIGGNIGTNILNSFIGNIDATELRIGVQNRTYIKIEPVGNLVLGSTDLPVTNIAIKGSLKIDGTTDFSNKVIKSHSANVITNDYTNFILSDSVNGAIIFFTKDTDITVTVPNNLSVGFNVMMIQGGNGIISINKSPNSTDIIKSKNNFNKSGGINSMISLVKINNQVSSTNIFYLFGDLQ